MPGGPYSTSYRMPVMVKGPGLLSVTYGWSQSCTALNGLISGAGLTA